MVWHWWVPECYTDIFTFRNWDCSPELLLPIIPNDFLGQVKPLYFLGKEWNRLVLWINCIKYIVSSSFWYPDVPHSPFGHFLLQTKLLFYSDIITAWQRIAKCHWLQLLLHEAFPKATDMAGLTNINLIHSHCPTAINRGSVCWSELTVLCFIALWAAFPGFPQVYSSEVCMPL